jgi:hypothetical protein
MSSSPPVLFSAKVLYAFDATADDECAVQPGEIVEVLEVQGEWWECRVTSSDGARSGILPASYAEKIVAGACVCVCV